jgi:CarD family transcriptional regulator
MQGGSMMFKAGDAVVHPARGAGIVTGVEKREWHDTLQQYYQIRLLGQLDTRLMIPTSTANKIGLRRVIPRSKLKRLWRVLLSDPDMLPDEHKERYQLLKEKLVTGDVFQIAEVVRDMAWRERRNRSLTTVGRQMYEKGIRFLAGEVAAVQDMDFADAEGEVKRTLLASLSSATVQ